MAESKLEGRRIKILFNNDEFTKKFIWQHTKNGLCNPLCNGGFWIKYNGKTKYYQRKIDGEPNSDIECTLQEIIGNHVVITVTLNNYFYQNKSGWYLNCSEIVVQK